MALVKRWVVLAHPTNEHPSRTEPVMVLPRDETSLPMRPSHIGVRSRKNTDWLNMAWVKREDAELAAKYYAATNKNLGHCEYSVALIAYDDIERVFA